MKSIPAIVAVLILAALAAPAVDAGVYQVAYWRELGAYENQAPPAGQFGMHDVWIRVWNEDGSPRAGVALYNTGHYYWGVTNSAGLLHIQLWSSASDFYCSDGSHTSEVTPIFNENRWPHSGHYSWEIGFVFRASSTPTGIFDTNYDGILNSVSGDNCYIDAPCMRSLAFVSTKPTEACSDAFTTSGLITEAGQTFVARGDRVIAAKAGLGSGGGFNAQILSGGPNGAPVGTVAVAAAAPEYQSVMARWPFDGVPVVPGQTYYLKITAPGGGSFSCQRTLGNTYTGGSFYANKVADTTCELMGAVVMAWSGYGSSGRITGHVRDTAGSPIGGAVVQAGSVTAQTDTGGRYTMFNVAPGNYAVVANKPNYSRQVLYNRVVTAGSTATVNFDSLKWITNVLTNPGFENGLTGWNVYGSFNIYDSGQFACPSHGGDKFAGNISSYGTGSGRVYQLVPVTGDYEYILTAWYFTDAYAGSRASEFPSDNVCRIGIDPTGGTDPYSANLTWTGWSSSHVNWSEVSLRKNAQPPYAQMSVWLDYNLRYSHEWNKAGFDDVMFGRSTPVIVIDQDPVVTSLTSTTARIGWHTNVKSDARVDYGPTAAYGQYAAKSESAVTHSVDLVGLLPNTTYHFKVTSAAAGYDSGSSIDFTFKTPRLYTPVASIADLDSLPDGEDVKLTGKLVTAGVDQLGTMFYISEANRLDGIRVNFDDAAIHEGDIRDVYGTLDTIDSERCIICTQTAFVSSGNAVPPPFGLRLGDLESWQRLTGGLVRGWGLVSNPGSSHFYLTDAEGAQAKVSCGSLIKPTGFAAVTGCFGRTGSEGGLTILRARKQSDITAYP